MKQINPVDEDASLEEFVGTDKSTKADPKRKGAPHVAVAPRGIDPITGLALVEPVAVAVYVPTAKGQSHPKVSRKGAADRLDEAEAVLSAASLEVSAARNHLLACEHDEAAAHSALIALMPAPSAADVHRAMLESETAAKLQRVAEGQPAVAPKVITARSAIDLAATNRPRTSARSANAPLQRNVV